MADNEQLVSALTRLVFLPDTYGRTGVLLQLMGTATEFLGLAGATVTLIEDGHCEVAGATPDGLREIEATQRDCERGPGMEALRRGESVAVEDVRAHRAQWPEYTSVAVRHGISAVAEIPMRLGEDQIGALGLFAPRPRRWTPAELSVGALLAGMAAGHLLTAAKLQRQQRLTDQLQHALTTRIVVEQAKGVIAGARCITPEAAYELIRGHARRRRVGVHEIAQAIVELGLRL